MRRTELWLFFHRLDSLHKELDGLQVVFSRLEGRFELEKADKASLISRLALAEQRAQQAAVSSNHALTEARSAQASVHSFESTGVAGKVTGMTSEVSSLKAQMDGLYTLMEDVMAAKLSTPSAGLSTQGQVSAVEMRAFKTDLLDRFDALKQKLTGTGPVRIGSRMFEGVDDCVACLKKWGVTSLAYEYIFDPISIITALRGPTVYAEDYNSGAILQLKTSRSPYQLAHAASFETTVPELFAGSKSSQQNDVSARTTFNGIKTPAMWDMGDGETGVKNFIEQGLLSFLREQMIQVDTLFGHTCPDFKSFVDDMRAEAAAGLRDFCQEVSALLQNMLHLSFGTKRYSEAEEKQVWTYVLVLCHVYFHEMHKVRCSARNLNGFSDNIQATGIAMWASIQGIAKHREFKACEFREHPRIFPKLHQYVTQKSARREELEAFTQKVKTLSADQSDLSAEVESLAATVARLESKLGRGQQAGGGDEDGGAGGGGGGKKRRQKKRAAAADEDAGN